MEKVVLCLGLLAIFGAGITRAQLSPGVLEVDASINGNTYVFTLGGCGDECGCRDGCCNKTVLQEKQIEYLKKLVEDSIGYGTDFAPPNSKRCDLQPNWTAIYQEPFKFNGRIDRVEFLICTHCSDASVADSTLGATPNTVLRFGVFLRSGLKGSCSFALKGYMELKRSDFPEWDAYLRNEPKPKLSAPAKYIRFDYQFTNADLVSMGVGDYSIEGLHFGFQWASAGCVCYQKWNSGWTGEQTMCMGTGLGQLDVAAQTGNYQYAHFPANAASQYGRRYSTKVTYMEEP